MKNLKNLSLSQTTISIILGSILGDGSLNFQKNYQNARLSIRQSIKHEAYLKYKANALVEISNPSSVILQHTSGSSTKQIYLYHSASLPELTEIHNLTYKKNTLDIKRKWLNNLTALSLCIWWLDHGNIISKGRQGVLCTDSFSLNSVNKLVRYLQVVWKIDTRVLVIKKTYKGKENNYYRILFNKENLEKWLKIIIPHIPVKEMWYKGIVRYNNIDLQQRWISEIKELLPEKE